MAGVFSHVFFARKITAFSARRWPSYPELTFPYLFSLGASLFTAGLIDAVCL